MGGYRTLIVAGLGAMGRGFFTLGHERFVHFENIWVIDKRQRDITGIDNAQFYKGNVENIRFLTSILKSCQDGGFVYVNLCSATDNYKIRKIVSQYGGAYIDTSCSMIFGQEEYRYSRLMPYTFRPTGNNNLHFVCCGINPGMVEIIARKAIQNDFPGYRSFDILLYEYDRFHVDLPGRALGVSWSPNTLIDEIMLSPTFQIKEGRCVEGSDAPTDKVKSCMNGEWLDSRLVGHEELWNFLLIPGVEVVNAYYSYAFRRDIMEVLAGDVNEARQRLVFPETNIPVIGVDTVAVRIVNKFNGDTRTFVWETDHKECQEQWGINAVQFQVASSLLVFFELLLKLGDWKKKTVISASTFPIEEFGWDYINELMIHYGVKWQPVEKMDLRIKYLT